jgi:2-amino-4-hydroxy-6-hydroxymethyldihydropteridine diphosphokinase
VPAAEVFIGLGGNLGDVPACLRAAVAALDALPTTQLLRVSAIYRNPPLGCAAQPDYLNAVAALATRLEPLELLDHLQAIEDAHGRTRGAERWQARTLDLDLLLYAQVCLDTPRLQLPHPGVHLRPFVIHPLAEIAPDAVVPGRGTAAALAACVPAHGLQRLALALQPASPDSS